MRVVGILLIVAFVVYEIKLGAKSSVGIHGTFSDHFRTFNKKLPSLFINIFVPLGFVLILRESHVYTVENLENLLVVLSIFVMIVFGILGDISGREVNTEESKMLKGETISNTIYIATFCLISMVITFSLMTSYTRESELDIFFKIFNMINFYLVFSIIINTLMLLKRFATLVHES